MYANMTPTYIATRVRTLTPLHRRLIFNWTPMRLQFGFLTFFHFDLRPS
ncbi:hypothetical protein HCH_01067 [Hahella chejuensis KCTC 2396]|uniref:Uncharacterized protein n=1 Tax=Hahella chejuensis (strain KCTC 2396) TaxID=349521 RepID=Q2SN26_HAHCH|nr:hypothetical protein HCH_01067 [Hahella chejuensis KCTC 2396]